MRPAAPWSPSASDARPPRGPFPDPTAPVDAADSRLYEAKRTGRNRIVAAAAEAAPTAPSPIEEERLATLAGYGRVEAPETSDELDRIAHLAAHVFGTPVAFVSMTGRNDVTLVGRHGIEAQTVSRADALCAETILGDEPLMVSDAAADPRFRGSSLTRQGVGFYAGAPLTDPRAGHRLGAICIVDTRPRRTLDDGERGVVVGFAHMVTSVLDRRRSVSPPHDEDGEGTIGAA